MFNRRNKWCLSVGCTGRDLCYILVSMFLLTYIQYTGLVNTEQFVVLTIIIVLCRVWDAFNDPMMGTIISNTKTRFGKFRPWVIIGCISNAITMVLLFTIRFNDGWANVAFLGIMYLLWGMTFTMNDISYWDLLPALTSDKKQRDSLTTWVAIFASLGSFVSAGVIPMMTTGNMVVAYRLISIIWATVFIACQLLVFFGVHDNPDDAFIERRHGKEVDKEELKKEKQKEKKNNLKDMVKILIGNKQLLVMAIVVVLYSLGSAILNAFGQNFFYFKYGYLQGANKMFIFTVVYAVGTLLSQFVYPILANKFKRAQLINASIILLVIGYVAFFLIANLMGGDLGFILLSILGVFIFVGQGVFYLTMLVMLTNTIEYGELMTGRNDSAIVFTIRPFMVKLAGAIQYGVVALTLVICQLTKITDGAGNVEIVIGMVKQGTITGSDGLTIGQAAINYLVNNYSVSASAISEASSGLAAANTIETAVDGLQAYEGSLFTVVTSGQIWGLTAMMTLLPIVLFVVAWIFQKRKYIISEEKYEEILAELKSRHEQLDKPIEDVK